MDSIILGTINFVKEIPIYVYIGIAIIGLLIYDISGGVNKSYTGVTRQHHYQPSYYTHGTDGKGHSTSTYHSEEYYLDVEYNSSYRTVNVTMEEYSIPNNADVIVTEHLGRSKFCYGKSIKRTLSNY